MKPLWTIVKVVLALALVIPLGIVVLATALGIFGALMGLAFMALRVALIGLMVYGAFRFVGWLFRSTTAPRSVPNEIRSLPAVDPHYEAAMRELDVELGDVRR
jgi:hypothetical protein